MGTVIEIAVTSPPDDGKRKKLAIIAKQGVRVIIRTVKSWSELTRLIEPPYKTEIKWGRRREIEGSLTARRHRAGKGINLVAELIEGLKATTPEYRRELLYVLRSMEHAASVCALSDDNPKRG